MKVVCCEYCIHLLNSLRLFPEQSVILHELGERSNPELSSGYEDPEVSLLNNGSEEA